MSPLAAPPPPDLPSMAFQQPALHTAQLLAARGAGTYTVRPGDTLYDIAARHDVSPQSLVKANKLKDSGRWIMPGQVLKIPGNGPAKVTPPATQKAPDKDAPTRSTSGGTVTVAAGDTLSDIALRHGTTASAIARANNLKDARLIYPGQRLTLPGSKASATSQPAPARASTSTSPGTSATSSGRTYTVRSGDTLSGIALRHGTTISALAETNGLSTGAFIFPGQRLTLPGGATAQAASRSQERSTPYDEHNIGDHKKGEAVDNTFLHYTYSDGIARSAAANREYLAGRDVPSRSEIKNLVTATAKKHGVDPTLMLALSYQESGWNHRAVSPANAIGAMQVIPTSGQWASALVGRDLNLLDPQDNVTAGVVIMKALLASADSRDQAIGSYYQGLGSVRQHGLFKDTRSYVANIKHHMKSM